MKATKTQVLIVHVLLLLKCLLFMLIGKSLHIYLDFFIEKHIHQSMCMIFYTSLCIDYTFESCKITLHVAKSIGSLKRLK